MAKQIERGGVEEGGGGVGGQRERQRWMSRKPVAAWSWSCHTMAQDDDDGDDDDGDDVGVMMMIMLLLLTMAKMNVEWNNGKWPSQQRIERTLRQVKSTKNKIKNQIQYKENTVRQDTCLGSKGKTLTQLNSVSALLSSIQSKSSQSNQSTHTLIHKYR